ncbi:piwi-like protein [Paratrimastix pyriformis]|uniref:Piwi-like protein n=1 Tax=Paratrimastix pyriformis TaxID=342808 RepID=A0ABQ8UHL6_9EUKA|nr:piwi-like protein [Paratrimastix pyriformis]
MIVGEHPLLAPRAAPLRDRVGRSVQLASNLYKFSLTPNTTFHEYNVRFIPEQSASRMEALIRVVMRQKFADAMRDKFFTNVRREATSAHCFCTECFDPFEAIVNTARPGAPESPCTVIFDLMGSHSGVPHPVLRIAFEKALGKMGLVEMVHNMYDPKAARQIPRAPFELWPGFAATPTQTTGGLCLAVDVSYRLLRTGLATRGRGSAAKLTFLLFVLLGAALPADTVLDELRRIRSLNPKSAEDFAHRMAHILVITRYNNCTYRITGVELDKNPTKTFPRRIPGTKPPRVEEVTFENYVQSRYGAQTKDHRQPLVRAMPTRGPKSEVLLIPEHLFLTGLTDEVRSDFRLMKSIKDCQDTNPRGRFQSIGDLIQKLDRQGREELAKFGISFDRHGLAVQGRVLPPQRIVFGNMTVSTGGPVLPASATSRPSPCLLMLPFSVHALSPAVALPFVRLPAADWSRAFHTSNLLEGKPLNNWMIFFPENQGHVAHKFVGDLRRVAHDVPVGEPVFCPCRGDLPEDVDGTLEQVGRALLWPFSSHPSDTPPAIPLARPKAHSSPLPLFGFFCLSVSVPQACNQGRPPQIAVVVLPDKDKERYKKIKQLCVPIPARPGEPPSWKPKPIPTQCVQAESVPLAPHTPDLCWHRLTATTTLFIASLEKGLSVTTKLWIQMQAKMGGVPWGVQEQTAVGLTASFDRSATRYFSRAMGQATGTQDPLMIPTTMPPIVPRLQRIIESALVEYAKNNRDTLPKMILLYRNGAGLDQFRKLLTLEVPLIYQACDAVRPGGGYRPKVAYIAMRKKTNTRFVLADGYSNAPPGTVIDDPAACMPGLYDFYLISQSVAPATTASPVHYTVLSDNTGLPSDYMQMFTYRLCHTYYNWSGTVSQPGVIQYAHRLAQMLTDVYVRNAPHSQLQHCLHFL